MASSRKTVLLPILMILVAGLSTGAGYLGAYYTLFEQKRLVIDNDWSLHNEPLYRVDHPLVRAALTPANRLDRQLRPDYWTAVGIIY